MSKREVDGFIGIVDALFKDKRFTALLNRGVAMTLKQRNEVLPVDDMVARAVHYHGLRETIRALAKSAQAHNELPIAGKLRALLPQLPSMHPHHDAPRDTEGE